ncbi:hypothetical protein MKW92_045170 [Papaver armeniacum]|nr:hypothetical protein MKW92_045170 [Papaver armeniacum]
MRSKLQSLVAETPRKSHWLRVELNTMLSHCPGNDCCILCLLNHVFQQHRKLLMVHRARTEEVEGMLHSASFLAALVQLRYFIFNIRQFLDTYKVLSDVPITAQ